MLADCIRLAQTNNEALEALLQKFAPLIKKCGRQLHIEDGNEEMILAFIELVKDFSPSNLRNIDDGTVVQYIKQSMYHYCFRIYKKYHHVETVIGWDEISPKEEAEYLATQDKIQLNDGLLTELQIDVLTKREREIITKTNYPVTPRQKRSRCRSNRGIIDSPTPLFTPFCRFRYRSRGQIHSHQYPRTSSTNDPFLKWFSYASRMMRIAMSTSPF
mgnify:CR=1 FL=1